MRKGKKEGKSSPQDEKTKKNKRNNKERWKGEREYEAGRLKIRFHQDTGLALLCGVPRLRMFRGERIHGVYAPPWRNASRKLRNSSLDLGP